MRRRTGLAPVPDLIEAPVPRPSLGDRIGARAPLVTAIALVALVGLMTASLLGVGRGSAAGIEQVAREQAALIEHQQELLADQVRLTRSLLFAHGDLLVTARTSEETNVLIGERLRELLRLTKQMLTELRAGG